MSHTYLTMFQRTKIEIYLEENYSYSQIAEKIGVHKSTISREVKRAGTPYKASIAQEKAMQRSSTKGRPSKFNAERQKAIIERLYQTWSPEQIAHRDTHLSVSFKTIYNWIACERLPNVKHLLRRKGKPNKSSETRGKFATVPSIHDRPEEIDDKISVGHWEGDTMVSSRGESKSCYGTFRERLTRLYLAFPMEDRTKESMFKAIKELVQFVGPDMVKSITVDRGKEFACYREVIDLGIDIYFADPYAAYQRGSNENGNKDLREFYPKKTDLGKVSRDDLFEKLYLINNRPRKCLGWKTPIEAFREQIELLQS